MPVFKFRGIEDMKRRAWREPGDPSLYRAIRHVLDVGRRTRARRFPPGVHKHRSIEALNAQTDRWHAQTMPHSFGLRPDVDPDKLNRLGDELETEAAARSLERDG